MPELPEVEVLVRHLAPRIRDRIVQGVEVRRGRSVGPVPPSRFERTLRGARVIDLTRRGKYLVFRLGPANGEAPFCMLGHLGMTGRMYLKPAAEPVPRTKRVVAVLDLGPRRLVFEDVRRFGRLTLDTAPLAALGPEPLGGEFTLEYFAAELKRSAQAIKVKLLDQALLAGVGNIYASESLFRAAISPRFASRRLTGRQVERLWQSIRTTLARAIRFGAGRELDWEGTGSGAGSGEADRMFYYGQAARAPEADSESGIDAGAGADADADDGEDGERFLVYDRAGRPCRTCATPIHRIVQAARSTFFCPRCQGGRARRGKTRVDGGG